MRWIRLDPLHPASWHELAGPPIANRGADDASGDGGPGSGGNGGDPLSPAAGADSGPNADFVTAGRATVDAAAAKSCTDARAAAGCSARDVDAVKAACSAVVVGKVAPGLGCRADFECAAASAAPSASARARAPRGSFTPFWRQGPPNYYTASAARCVTPSGDRHGQLSSSMYMRTFLPSGSRVPNVLLGYATQ